MLQCHVNHHIHGGMAAKYTVLANPNGKGAKCCATHNILHAYSACVLALATCHGDVKEMACILFDEAVVELGLFPTGKQIWSRCYWH